MIHSFKVFEGLLKPRDLKGRQQALENAYIAKFTGTEPNTLEWGQTIVNILRQDDTQDMYDTNYNDAITKNGEIIILRRVTFSFTEKYRDASAYDDNDIDTDEYTGIFSHIATIHIKQDKGINKVEIDMCTDVESAGEMVDTSSYKLPIKTKSKFSCSMYSTLIEEIIRDCEEVESRHMNNF